MEAPTIIVVGVILALLAALSFILMKISSKEYPPAEEVKTPKFEVGKISHPRCSDPVEAEKPKKKKRKYYNKKKPAATATVEKKSVGRPRKSN